MIIDDKDFEDMASSADPTDAQGQDGQTAQTGADTADTSTATGETEDDGLLSVVRDVVEANRTPEDQSASPAEGEEGADGDAASADDDDDFSNVPFSKHPDFRRLIRKKNEYREQAKAFEQDAVRYQNVQNFMDQNGLAAEEAADMLVVAGLMKTNPVEAWKRAKPTIQKLLIAAGEVLPDDLKARVQGGELSHDAALEVSRSRAMQASSQAQQSFETQRRQKQEQQTAASALTSAADAWETKRREKDPNFEAKQPLLMKELVYLQRVDGIPTDPAGVNAQLEKAYKAVKLPAAPVAATTGGPARPAPGQKKAITPIRGGQVAGGAKPEVKSTMDVVANVLAKRRSA